MELEELQSFILKHDNTKNFTKFCIPDISKQEPCILGVDEAGRGPVLGPMVYGIAFCPQSKEKILKHLGCADSKELKEEQREDIFIKMASDELTKSTVGWAVEVISPHTISNSMLKRVKTSLNEISMGSAIDLIKEAVELGVCVSEIYVDTVGPPEKYQAKLKSVFPDYKITVAKKADSTYPIVSAASICAKVVRDHALKVWKFPRGTEVAHTVFGSGYPGDPLTKAFLQNPDPVFGYPRLVRFSWSTSELALKKFAFNVEFEEQETVEKKPRVNSKKMTEFYVNENTTKRNRNRFFGERSLKIVSEF